MKPVHVDALDGPSALPGLGWERTHARVVRALMVVVAVVAIVGVLRSVELAHVPLDVLPAIVATAVTFARRLPRRARSIASSAGLMATAGAFVHFMGGRTEAHFLYFVLLGLLALYDDWVPYAAAVVVVSVEHTVIGAIAPEALYDGQAAQREPWLMAGLHGGAVLAASAVGFLVWRLRDVEAQSSRQRQWASDEDLRLTFDAAPIGMALVDLEGRFVRVNPALCTLVGRTAAELVGTSFRDITREDDVAKDVELLEECLAGIRDGYAMEKRYVHADGHDVWVQLNVVLACTSTGELSHFIAQVIDMTERRVAEHALLASEARFAAMVEHGSDLMSITDAGGRLIYASPAYLPLLGLDPAAKLGTPLQDFVHPDDLQMVTDTALALAPHPGASATVEVRFAHADGSWRWFEATTTNRLDDPAVNGFVINSRDVTDRVLAAERLTHEATHDALTGLANRALLHHRLAEEASAAQQVGDVLVAAFVDLDHFKAVNDTHGHHVGDAILREAGRRLSAAARRDDMVARLGGDEFVVLARVASVEHGAALADRVCQSFHDPVEVEGLQIPVSASVGLATTAESPDVERLLEAADRALYEAKARGRARWATYVPNMGWHAPALGRLQNSNVLDSSVAEARQHLAEQYQQHVSVTQDPIVVHVDGRIVGASPGARALLGVEAERIVGRDVREFVTPESTEATEARRAVFARGGWPAPEVYALRAGDGGDVDIEVTSTPTVWAGSLATQLWLRPVRDRWEEIVRIGATLSSASTQAVVLTELDERIVSWNDGAVELYGWSADEALGRTFSELVPTNRSSAERERLYEQLRTLGRWSGIATHVRQDGAIVAIDATVEIVHDRDGRRVGLMLLAELCRDATGHSDAEAELLAEVEVAIAERQLRVAYQGIVDRVGRGVKVEALVRWQHPTRGWLLPGSFISVVERSPLIGALTGYVLEEACGQVARWRSQDRPGLELAVNVSALELSDRTLPERVRAALASSGLPADALWLEVTETALASTDRSDRIITELADMGVRFALDDFGIGFATLAQLHRFPAKALKIDRLFVDGMTHDAGDAAIVRSVLALGREMEMMVIAEGVETEEQRSALEQMGCDLFQGYLFERPSVPPQTDAEHTPWAQPIASQRH